MKNNVRAFNNLSQVISTLPEDNLTGKLRLVAVLSWPAVMAQLSSILMEYIDAAMVGHLGSGPAASIGLMATTTWLFWGLGAAAVTGFSVQVAHSVERGAPIWPALWCARLLWLFSQWPVCLRWPGHC